MFKRLIRLVAVLAAAGATFGAHGQDERAALAVQRQKVGQEFAAEQAECAARFAVSSCLEQARLKRRDALASLQRRESEQGRRERLAAAQKRQQASTAKAARRAATAVPAVAAAVPRHTTRSQNPDRMRSSIDPTTALPAPKAGKPGRLTDEQRARAAFEQRRQAATAHRLKVEQRRARRSAAGVKPAAPLPSPASAPAR